MTEVERLAICKAVAVISLWGHGWIGSTLMEDLDQALPFDPPWTELYRIHSKTFQRECIGVIDKEHDLQFWMNLGYYLTNWGDDGCDLFNPPPMHGLKKYVSKELADKYK